MEFPSQSTLLAAVCVITGIVALIYRALLPKPLPGVPYNKASAKRILGDAPDVCFTIIAGYYSQRVEELIKHPIDHQIPRAAS